ncbi:GNAT family N-acetyltransferase [Halovenus carboxidivorans]|nr:GNAT family N-acetyltransferase [Halovenus carboxidivorans]
MCAALTIRRYEPADAEAVWELHERALRNSPLTFVENAPADEDLTAISERYLDAGGEFLVGLVDSSIVASGGFQPRAGETAELRRMRVDPAHQGNGYGGEMLDALEDRAREAGIRRLVLSTNEQLKAARSLYESHGYTELDSAATEAEMVGYEKRL